MKLSLTVLISTLVIGLFYATFAPAQQHPMIDKFADKVVAKYQGTSCDELKAEKATQSPALHEPTVSTIILTTVLLVGYAWYWFNTHDD